jgi:hypothetical protein
MMQLHQLIAAVLLAGRGSLFRDIKCLILFAPMPEFPDSRVIAWVVVRDEDGTDRRIPWLRDPVTPEEIELSQHAQAIIERAQQQAAQSRLSGKQRRHRERRLKQQRNKLRENPQSEQKTD